MQIRCNIMKFYPDIAINFDITTTAYIHMHVKTTFIMEADSLNPDQTIPNLAGVDLGS